MSVLLSKILWYRLKDRQTELISDNIYQSPIHLGDAATLDSGKGLDIKNNVASINLKNPFRGVVTTPAGVTFNRSEYVGTSDVKLMFAEQDQIKIWVRYTDDGADPSDVAWTSDVTTNPVDSYLLGTYFVSEFNVTDSTSKSQMVIKSVDKTYVIFNKILAKSFTETDAMSAPEIIQKIIRLSCQNSDSGAFYGTGADANVRYDIDAKLVSEGGYIEDTRRATREDGSVNPDTTFPDIQMSKVWKPIYEWVNDLSQILYTNTVTENAGDTAFTYGRPFIFWVDEGNQFHWVYPSTTVDNTLEVGVDIIYDCNMTKSVYDVTNMIIYNAGTDMYGTGCWGYYVDKTSLVRSLKMRYVPMIDIAKKLIATDYGNAFNPASTRDGSPAGYPVPQFPSAYGGGLTACAFSDTPGSITSDSTYNNALRKRALLDGQNKAMALLSKLANARWKGTVTVKGGYYSAGNLVKLTDNRIGLNEQLLRIMDVRHNITKLGWKTTLTLEEDASVVTGVVALTLYP